MCVKGHMCISSLCLSIQNISCNLRGRRIQHGCLQQDFPILSVLSRKNSLVLNLPIPENKGIQAGKISIFFYLPLEIANSSTVRSVFPSPKGSPTLVQRYPKFTMDQYIIPLMQPPDHLCTCTYRSPN